MDKFDAAGLIIRLGELVLLGKRSKVCENLKGYWSMPCGAIEKGETPLECCEREFKEETGVSVTGEIKYLNSFSMENGGKFYAYYSDIKALIFPSNSAVDAVEHEEWGFFKIQENTLPCPMTKETRKTILKLK
jgi:8-oxo-dGTP pyrophosphatase MutT (NUDIX family)